MKKSWLWFKHLSLLRQIICMVVLIGLAGTIGALAFFPLAPFAPLGWLWGVLVVSLVGAGTAWLYYQPWRGPRWMHITLSIAVIYGGLILVTISFLLLVIINSASLNRGWWAPRLSTLTSGPLNLISYLAGLGALPVAVVAVTLINRAR